MSKLRLDQLLLERKLATDIQRSRALIGAGEVYVNDTISDKAGLLYNTDVTIRLKQKCPFVSRGGLKLAGALSTFEQPVEGLICVDIGASTGGFSDCLLQNGAKQIYAIDVAYGQLAWKIRQDERVEVLERFNARKLTAADINEAQVELAVMDVSFISLTKILPALFAVFPADIAVIALVKPQFELPKSDIGPGGVVTDPHLHEKAINKIRMFVEDNNLHVSGVITSPIQGPKGNTEFLIHITSA
ncbi:MAG: TlyA family rRNA (cytidine-2'-O)-methyltransferase [Desulfotalea sp.]|nr:MAG: TlyA family rRNA (cytidine-2'-O)-methyltransferase [Desulfotalea sp.]